MIQRGVGYEIAGSRSDARAVVLTKTAWNERMSAVGLVPMLEPAEVDSPFRVYENPGFVYDVTKILSVPRERVGEARFAPADSILERIEQKLGELLELPRLMSEPPRAVRTPAGVIDYPRWGEVYYIAGQRFDGENKRYVVVSDDRWNQQKRTVLVIRLTSQPKFPSDEFPEVAGYQACCGELSAVPAAAVNMTGRPATGATRLRLTDMAAVAHGIVNTHVIREYLDEVELEVVR